MRSRAGARRRRSASEDRLQRRPRRRVLRGADPDAEGPGDRAAPRLAPRRGRLPALDRARARRDRSRPSRRGCGLASKCEIEAEEHSSAIVLGGSGGIPTRDYGVPAVEVLDEVEDAEAADEELERLRILARTPRWGREIDDGILPAEAGLDERAVSFTKGCYPGQEPLSRLQHRGHVNRSLRVLELDGEAAQPGRRGRGRRHGRRPRDERGSRARARLRPGRGARGRRGHGGGQARADTLTLPRP